MFKQSTPGRSTASVLVIEPSATNQAQICDCLRQLPNIRILAASSGKLALAMIQENWPSMVLLDTALNDTDGLTLTRTIRTQERSRNETGISPWTPIIFLSTATSEEVLAEGILAGGDDFLCKPVSEVVLLSKVSALLRIAIRQQEICDVHRQLKNIASLDSLTGIPNRRHFDDTLATEWKRCLRTDIPLSIVLGDIDFFKQFNDIYGHQAGDACLKAIAGSLSESLFRVEDTVSRYGGEEFAAILPGTDAAGAFAVAERMRQSALDLRIPHEHGVNGQVSCSFGVASLCPTADEVPQRLVHLADTGLYTAKQAGRNRISIRRDGS
jgi:diguanylate cyclase (GGDEF)-like protein